MSCYYYANTAIGNSFLPSLSTLQQIHFDKCIGYIWNTYHQFLFAPLLFFGLGLFGALGRGWRNGNRRSWCHVFNPKIQQHCIHFLELKTFCEYNRNHNVRARKESKFSLPNFLGNYREKESLVFVIITLTVMYVFVRMLTYVKAFVRIINSWNYIFKQPQETLMHILQVAQ